MADVERELTAKGEPKLLVTDPEYTISVIGLVAAFCSQPIVGLVLTAIALKRSRAAGRHNTYALVGFIISIIMTGLWLIFVALYAFAVIVSLAMKIHG